MNIIYNFSQKHIEQVHQGVWWGKERSLTDTIKCVQGSQVCIGILDGEDNLIAFTRVISDFIYKAIIFDVIVNAEHNGKGLAKQLMKLVKSHQALQEVKHFELYCLPDMESFYLDLGFSTDVGGIKLMRHVNCAQVND